MNFKGTQSDGTDSEACGVMDADESGWMASPRYPQAYPPRTFCQQVVQNEYASASKSVDSSHMSSSIAKALSHLSQSHIAAVDKVLNTRVFCKCQTAVVRAHVFVLHAPNDVFILMPMLV